LKRGISGHDAAMMKTFVFLAGAACGFAAANYMSESQRSKVMSSMRAVGTSEPVQRLTSAAKDVAGTAVDTALGKVEHASDAAVEKMEHEHARS
jgi:hypothetical protein